MDYTQQILAFFSENFMVEFDGKYRLDDSLLEKGIIDSTGVLEIVTFLEESFRIEVEDEEIIPSNFDSIDNINSYLLNKLTIKLSE
jgi:acyl carrier protein